MARIPDPVRRERSIDTNTNGVESKYFAPAIKNFDKLFSNMEAALTDNLALRQSALRVYVAEQDISRQQAARFPVLSLNLNGGLDYSSAASDRTSLSVGLSVPLYEGDLVGARVRQAALARPRPPPN